jgi:hypothetical protein
LDIFFVILSEAKDQREAIIPSQRAVNESLRGDPSLRNAFAQNDMERMPVPHVDSMLLRHFTSLIAAAVFVFLLGSLNSFASDNACGGLQTAKPSELLAMIDNAFSDDLLAPGINCTSEKMEPKPELCDLRTTITMDRKLGEGRRLIASSTVNRSPNVRPDESHRDDIFVFACVDGQTTQVLQFGSERGATVESAEPDKVVVHSTYQAPDGSHPNQMSFVWDDKLQFFRQTGTSFEIEASTPPRMACDVLPSVDANRLVAMIIEISGNWHGAGCYPDAKDCQWKESIEEDRMLGSERRFIEVGLKQTAGSGVYGEVYIFGCVSGQVKALFNTRVEYGADVQHASADTLILARAKQAPDDEESEPSWQELMTFSWNKDLNNYLLSSVHFRPDPDEEP